ncbi:hypothetical protein ABW21_db0208475 [Orbilia brochopaga]|nr:hypothetical protein ABW21_db0208475 [Drechslerella brochopaga]
MARPNKPRMEWTLASCRTPRSSRKDIEDIFFKSSPGSNRVSKPKNSPKKDKKVVAKASWDPTGDDSSQTAEDEGNDSEDESDDSSDKPYVKGPALTSKGHLKGIKHDKVKRNKKTSSVGPTKQGQAFSRKTSGGRIRDQIMDEETPIKIRRGPPVMVYGTDSDYSSLSTDPDNDDDEHNNLILDSAESGMSDDASAEDSDEEDMEDVEDDDDDQSILEEETNFITSVPLTSEIGQLNLESGVANSPSALSAETDDENEDIYMDMDDPVVQEMMKVSYTICDDDNVYSDDMLEPYYSDEAFADSEEYDSDATIYDAVSLPSRSPSPTPVPESANEKTPTRPLRQPFKDPKMGWFTPSPGRSICSVRTVPGGFKAISNMTYDEFLKKGDNYSSNSSTTAVTSPMPRASEELWSFIPNETNQCSQFSQYSASIPSEDWDFMSSANREVLFGSDWGKQSVSGDYDSWIEYIATDETTQDTSNELDTDVLNNASLMDEEELTQQSSPLRSFSVPVTAFRHNQNNALSRNNSIASSVQHSGIKKNAPRKDSSLTPSQRRKSDATHPGRKLTFSPPVLIPLEPLFGAPGELLHPA